MRLTDLAPKWFSEEGRVGVGLTFNCPGACCAGADVKQRLAVPFANPIDGGGPGRFGPERYHWTRSGDTFEALTLTPSVDVSRHGHWHGFITNGEVITC